LSSEKLNNLESLFNLEPQSPVPLKRKYSTNSSLNSSLNSNSNSNDGGEIDFTNAFVFKKQRKMPVLNDIFLSKNKTSNGINSNNNLTEEINIEVQQKTSRNSITSLNSINNSNISLPVVSNNIPFESCGFCSDDTPCVCREIETEQQLNQKREIKNIRESKLKIEIEIEKKERELILELTKSAQNDDISQIAKCTGNPGTCLQCRSDPLSTLFCKTVAEKSNKDEIILPSISSRESSISTNLNDLSSSAPILSNLNSNNNSNSNIVGNNNYRLPSLESLKLNEAGKQFIPCANAYKTISNHLDIRNIGVNNITNNLNTKGMFVEIGSVVSCLRELDRKFSSS
ncbi:hypothetical protein C6P40_004000, partial [Pichia californica]